MYKQRLRAHVVVSVFALCVVTPAMGQVFLPPGATDTGLGGGNAIAGTILLSTGRRLERQISVRLQTMTKGDRIASTDDSGSFAFRGLPSGSYAIIIDKEKDFEPYRGTVDIRQFAGAPPQVYNLNIRLQLKPGVDTKPGVLNVELANVPPAAVALYQKALQSAQAGDRKGAIEQLKQAVSEYSNFMLAYNELGFQYMKLNDLNKADEALRSALKISPDAAMPLLNHGIVLALMGKFEPAVTELNHSLKQREQSANGHFYLGQALANLGRLDEAAIHLSRAVELGGDEVKDAHRFLGIIYLQRGEREHGVTELETYLKLSPNARDADQIRQIIRQSQKARPD
jgi:tetratricopeptide (TPR) repeat protein